MYICLLLSVTNLGIDNSAFLEKAGGQERVFVQNPLIHKVLPLTLKKIAHDSVYIYIHIHTRANIIH